MKTTTVIALMLAGFLAAGQCPGQITDSLPEKYVKKVLIEAKWGDGPGEFGLEPINETHAWESFIMIDKHGNIVIADPNNYRINIFNKQGIFLRTIQLSKKDRVTITGIGVDSKGHFYVASSASMAGEIVLEFNNDGKLINKYIFTGIWVGETQFLEDEKGIVYIHGGWFWETTPRGDLGNISIPLAFGKEKELTDISARVNEFKQLKITSGRKIKNNMTGYENWSGNILVLNGEGKVIFSEQHNNIRDIKSFKYKNKNLIVSCRSAFDCEGNIYILQGMPQYLQVVKCITNIEELQ